MLTLDHREARAHVYSEAELAAALTAAKQGFRRTQFATEPRENGFVIKTEGGPVQRWLSEI